MQTILSIQDISYAYPDGTQALHNVSLEIGRGEKIAVLGPNGSGKSTLFLCLNGIHKVQSGHIVFDGKPCTYDKRGMTEMRKNVGVVFQDPETQLFCVDVYQEVAFGPRNLKCGKEELHTRVMESLEAMDIVSIQDKPPHFLSGGQKKRVTVASVLSMSPQVLLFDEPTSSLDPAHAQSLMNEMETLSARGITVLMATHDVNMAYAWADKVVVLEGGALCACDTPLAVFSDKTLLQRTGLEKPFVLRIFEKLCASGILSGEPPRTVAELEEKLEQRK